MESGDLINVYLRTIRAFNEDDVETIQRQVAPKARYVSHAKVLYLVFTVASRELTSFSKG